MIYRTFLHYLTAALLMLVAFPQGAKAANPKNGQTLFLNNCASCHNNDMKSKATGPGLYGVQGRWDSQAELYSWIKNSQALVAAGNPRAVAIYNEFGKSVMTAFPLLKDSDIDDILAYVENKGATGCFDPNDPECQAKAQGGGGGGDAKGAVKEEEGPNYTLWVLFGVLFFSTALLARYIHNLNRLASQREGENVQEKSLLELILNPAVVKLTVFGLVLLGGYTTVNSAIGLGRQQGYAPEQPIKFSHALHAGKHGIDCQYCHDGARRSKHGSIPAVNTCLNCHTAVKKGPQYGTGEILKIYAAARFNPNKTTHAEYYFPAELPFDSVVGQYRSWLENEMLAEELKAEPAKTKAKIESQLAAIKPMYNKPIEWVRIHNLPDHAYFNHAQHVTAGGQACQTCHGKVEEMEVVKQHSPLSMGWCINCHRQTQVKFKDNPYYAKDAEGYKSYEKYHGELEAGKRNGVTVEDIGGLECQKCHY